MHETSLVKALRHADPIHPIVPFATGSDRLLHLDFTQNNKALTPELLLDTKSFSAYIEQELNEHKCRYGIGGYAEHRTIYSSSAVFDAAQAGEEPRRLHLGTDIWGKPHTPVRAPLDGIVHSYAFNNRFGDYGATIILSHALNGLSFFSLYGHLSLSSIKNLQEGNRIEKGEVIAELGIPAENGQWPPHLHFQLISDIGDWKGDYPGVCKYSEKEEWLVNCPDPELVLRLNDFVIH